jgi:MoaA/NifB/PqqE/SkfB family radical SAM enzyme
MSFLKVLDTIRTKPLVAAILKITGVFMFFVAMFSLFPLSPWQIIFISAFLDFVVMLTIFAGVRLMEWRQISRSGIRGMTVRIYLNGEEAPPKYQIDETLQYIAKKRARLEIISRTSFRWLCGDEKQFVENRETFHENQTKLQDRIREVIKSGGSIHFILQNPHKPVPFFSRDDNLRLFEHASEAIKSYEEILSDKELLEAHKARLILSFTDEVIENSMSRVKEEGMITRLTRDLGSKFKISDVSSETISKPFLVAESKKHSIELFREEFDFILNGAISKEGFDGQKKQAHEEVETLIQKYPHHSQLRGDRSEEMAATAARYFLAESGSPFVEKIPPPVSVQLLVTNQCTTRCKMCTHYDLFDSKNELNDTDLKHVLDCIKDLGTKAVIISGGEPLARPGLFGLLQYGNQIGLSIGLLTNGVKKAGASLDDMEAGIISQTCSWVQVSIDSFDQSTYEIIRGGKHLQSALDSLHKIDNAGLEKLEVCFTIQKDNLDELPTIHEKIAALLPRSVPVRFKFAHGPGRDFLCADSEHLKDVFKGMQGNKQANFDYLTSMINEYFSYEGISQGQPLRETMIRYGAQEYYTCQVLHLTCKIDAKGDVYPCFLFDDNNSRNSSIRNRYRIGSLRAAAGPVMGPSPSNKLAQIWYENERLRLLRRDSLPVDREACNFCTRHFYQNEYLNKLYKFFKDHQYSGVVEDLAKLSDLENSPTFWV